MPEITGRDQGGRFEKGQSGNPAGRPKGALTKRTREIAAIVLADGVTPLEAMLTAMRTAEDWANAAKYAQMAAPYVHARLAPIEHGGMEDNRITLVIQRFSDAPEAVEHAFSDDFFAGSLGHNVTIFRGFPWSQCHNIKGHNIKGHLAQVDGSGAYGVCVPSQPAINGGGGFYCGRR